MRHGIASSVHRVDALSAAGDTRSVVLKLCVRDDPTEPDQAGREADVLALVAGGPVPAPIALALDRDGSECGVPALLMTRLEGGAVLRPSGLRPWLRGLAEMAARIHSLPVSRHALPTYSTYALSGAPEPPRSATDRQAWAAAIERIEAPPPPEPACFIHRDFHPGNVLWTGSRVSGVVDWLQGCWGPPAADLGHCRWNLWYLHGPEAADAFLEEYRRLVPGIPTYERYWDLAAALGGQSLQYRSGDPRSIAVADAIVEAWVRGHFP